MGILSGAVPRVRDGCFLYVSDRGFAHFLLTRRGFTAITLGHVIVSAREPSDEIWRHEMRHVAQYERVGCAFLPLYMLLRVRHGYRDHPLERDATTPTRLFDA